MNKADELEAIKALAQTIIDVAMDEDNTITETGHFRFMLAVFMLIEWKDRLEQEMFEMALAESMAQ